MTKPVTELELLRHLVALIQGFHSPCLEKHPTRDDVSCCLPFHHESKCLWLPNEMVGYDSGFDEAEEFFGLDDDDESRRTPFDLVAGAADEQEKQP